MTSTQYLDKNRNFIYSTEKCSSSVSFAAMGWDGAQFQWTIKYLCVLGGDDGVLVFESLGKHEQMNNSRITTE